MRRPGVQICPILPAGVCCTITPTIHQVFIWNFLGKSVPVDSADYAALQLYWRKKTIHLAGHEMGIFPSLVWFESDLIWAREWESPGAATLCFPAFLF